MAKLNLTNFTEPTAEEVASASAVIVQEVFVKSPISARYDVQTGIQRDSQIAFADGFDVIGEAITGCTPEEIGAIALTDKKWTPKLIGGRFTYCATDENLLLKILKQAKATFPDFFQRNPDQDEMQLIGGVIMNSIYGSILPKVWFSDTDADVFANAGNFKAGTNLGLFNQFDGLWSQIFADATIPRYTITKNTAESYALQALADGDSLTILKNVYKNASLQLKSNPASKIYVTRSIYENLLFTYAEAGSDNGGLTKDLQDGIQVLKFMGKVVDVEDAFDYTINTYQNNGTVWVLPHRAVFTVPSNIPIGTLNESDLANLEYIYDSVNKSNILDFGYFLDAKMLRADLISVAY